MRWLAVLVGVGVSGIAAAASKSEEQLTRARAHYDVAEFAEAAAGFERALSSLGPAEMGRGIELEIREKLVLSLYKAAQREKAVVAYRALLERFPTFQFNPDE